MNELTLQSGYEVGTSWEFSPRVNPNELTREEVEALASGAKKPTCFDHCVGTKEARERAAAEAAGTAGTAGTAGAELGAAQEEPGAAQELGNVTQNSAGTLRALRRVQQRRRKKRLVAPERRRCVSRRRLVEHKRR